MNTQKQRQIVFDKGQGRPGGAIGLIIALLITMGAGVPPTVAGATNWNGTGAEDHGNTQRIVYIYAHYGTRPATIGVADQYYNQPGWQRLAGPFQGTTPDLDAWRVACGYHAQPGYNAPDIVQGRINCDGVQGRQDSGYTQGFAGDWTCPARGGMRFTQHGAYLSGTLSGPGHWTTRRGGTFNGTAQGNAFQINIRHGDGTTVQASGRLTADGRRFEGTWVWYRAGQRIGSGSWNCERTAQHTGGDRTLYIYVNKNTYPATIGVADPYYNQPGWQRMVGPFQGANADIRAWQSACGYHQQHSWNAPDIVQGRINCAALGR